MDYADMIEGFWKRAEEDPLTPVQVALYLALLHIDNLTGLSEWFPASNSAVTKLTGLSRSGVLKTRKELESKGYIETKGETTKATLYHPTCSPRKQVDPTCSPRKQVDPTCSPRKQVPRADICISNTLDNIYINNNFKEKGTSNEVPEKKATCAAFPRDPFPGQLATIRELYNSVCGSYPRLVKLSDARKKAIRARLRSGYTVDDFKRLFEMAEESSFLKGQNRRNWSATFDWLITDANMAKVLDGNYQDRKAEEENENDESRRPAAALYERYLQSNRDSEKD